MKRITTLLILGLAVLTSCDEENYRCMDDCIPPEVAFFAFGPHREDLLNPNREDCLARGAYAVFRGVRYDAEGTGRPDFHFARLRCEEGRDNKFHLTLKRSCVGPFELAFHDIYPIDFEFGDILTVYWPDGTQDELACIREPEYHQKEFSFNGTERQHGEIDFTFLKNGK